MKTIFLYGVPGQYARYVSAVQHSGGEVLLSRDLRRTFDCDSLLLPGGGDIFAPLDAQERYLIQLFVSSSRPILGICRGMQALNVYFGGTLYRRISGHQLPRGDLVHPTCASGPLRSLMGPEIAVTSCHHQAVQKPGRNLAVVQRSEDGIIEGICHFTRPVLGVQWHPERQSYSARRPDAADAAPLWEYFLSL